MSLFGTEITQLKMFFFSTVFSQIVTASISWPNSFLIQAYSTLQLITVATDFQSMGSESPRQVKENYKIL